MGVCQANRVAYTGDTQRVVRRREREEGEREEVKRKKEREGEGRRGDLINEQQLDLIEEAL